MTGDGVTDGALLVALLVAVLLSVGLLIAGSGDRPESRLGSYIASRESDLAHVLMNGVMAWMVTPLFTGRSGDVVVVLFGGTAAVFGGLLVLGVVRPGYWRVRRPASAYHLVASLAMVYATVRMAGPAGAGHMHGMHEMPGMDMSPPVSGPAWVLAVLFALDAIGTAIVVLAVPDAALVSAAGGAAAGSGPDPDPGLRRRLRVAAVPHVVMDVAMVVMLIAR